MPMTPLGLRDGLNASCNSRWLRLGFWALAAWGTDVGAQSVHQSPREVEQIVDATLGAVLSPERELGELYVKDRGLRFDFARTMAAFGQVEGERLTIGNTALRPVVSSGNLALLNDCDQRGDKPCKQLGNSVYVAIEPVSTSRSEAVVKLHVSWAMKSSGRAVVTGFSQRIYLSRSGTGPWRFIRADGVLVP